MVFPSDTVYGLLADANNPQAVQKLIAFKERPKGKPISVFVSGFDMIGQVVALTRADLKRLQQILPGPFTVVLPSKHSVSSQLESEKGTLGVRLPSYGPVNTLVERFAGPVTATSANRSGHPPVHSIKALMNQLNDEQKAMIDLVVDIGELPRNKPSTVVDMTSDGLTVLREGDMKFSSTKIYKSASPDETAHIGRRVIQGILNDPTHDQSVVLILQGDLGAGKTQFMKGVAEYLKVQDRIISPTFVVYYEYPLKESAFGNLVHIDLYNVKDAEEFTNLGIEKYLEHPNILGIEWGEKSGEIIENLQKKATLIYICIKYVDETTREIEVSL